MTTPADQLCELTRFATEVPNRPALILDGGATVTYAQLEAQSCRVANLLRAEGLGVGSHIAAVVPNGTAFFEIVWAAMRTGVYVTPINWHLTPAEAAYIVEDCGAQILFVSADLAHIAGDPPRGVRGYAIGGDLPKFKEYEAALATQPSTPPVHECAGSWMFYSSGTTGRPKGVKPPAIGGPLGSPNPAVMLFQTLYGTCGDSIYLSPSPLYHAAPGGASIAMQRLGATVVVMTRFDAERALKLIDHYRVTEAQFVPTHLVRMLKLPKEVRDEYDISSLRALIHAGAPCSPEVKRACIDWFGPIVHEYYSGSEGVGFCAIDSADWLTHPGSVGRPLMGGVRITGEDGEEVPIGEEGQVWFENATHFEYHGDPEKTKSVFNNRGWATMGDIGHVDQDGFLYLTDRMSNTIISGGVNIYPREVEDVLIMHPMVDDVGVIGVPHPDMGEAVRAVVQLGKDVEPTTGLADELIAFARDRIAHFKCPTSVVFVGDLPRLPSGKFVKRMLPSDIRGLN